MAKKKEPTQAATLTKNPAAAWLGSLGGRKTAQRGPDYYRKLQAKRKIHAGGRPKKVQPPGNNS